jgi:outer membrane receptor protein involved in Fe transport
VRLFANVYNVLDEMYVQDALDNSGFNGYYSSDNVIGHDADAAEIFVGFPRTYNLGFQIVF